MRSDILWVYITTAAKFQASATKNIFKGKVRGVRVGAPLWAPAIINRLFSGAEENISMLTIKRMIRRSSATPAMASAMSRTRLAEPSPQQRASAYPVELSTKQESLHFQQMLIST